MDYAGFCRMLLDMSDGISYITDINSYELLFMTKAAMHFFGVKSIGDYQGSKCYEILQGKDAPCEFCCASGACGDGMHRWTHYIEKIDKWMMFEDFQTLIDGRLCRVGTATDITAEKKRSSRLSDTEVTETILLQCIRMLSMTDDLDTAVNSFLETLGRFYRADRAYILEINHEKNTFSNTFEWCYRNVSREIGNIQNLPVSRLDELGGDFRNRDGIYVADIDRIDPDSFLHSAMIAQDIRTMMVTPLTIDGKRMGFLGVDNPRVNLERKAILQATTGFVVEELKKRRLLRQLEYTSYTDLLTGTYNRNRYIDDLNEIRNNAPKTFGAIVVDVNGLKRINDLYGHKYGDQLIRRAARILTDNLDENIYRVGGDEFIVLIPDIGQEDFDARVMRLKHRFNEENDLSVSIGTSWDRGNLNVDKEIFRADERMYERKKSYYNNLISEEHLIKNGSAAKVRREIDEGLFVVHYQPQVDMRTGRIVGLEALVRKRDGEGGLRMPSRFIHFYEAHGMLPYVDIFVLKQAVACIKELNLQEKGIAVSVNISRDTMLLPGFMHQMEENCARHGIAPGSLKFEIAHKSITPGNEALMKVLKSIRHAGFRLVLDDFGEVGSNMDILAEVDFDEIKFSSAMSSGIEQKPKNRIMARNILRLCTEIQDAVHVIEGIESREQADFFTEHRCSVAQGFYYHRPMCTEGLKKLLNK